MELVDAVVEAAVSKEMEWGKTLVMPMGDLHLEGGAHRKMFRRDIEWGIEHGAYFIGMGDFLDVASPSNRQRIKSAALYDTVVNAMDEQAEEHIRRFARLTRGTEGRWLGVLEGHHYWEFADGTTSGTRIAKMLGCPYLGTCAFVRLRFRGMTHRRSVTIWCHHGAGGGQKASAPLNRIENVMNHFDADIYLMGHQHKLASAPIDSISMTLNDPPKLTTRTRYMVATGGYLRAYEAGAKVGLVPRGSYVEQRMLTPTSLGCSKIYVEPKYGKPGDHSKIEVVI